MRKLGVLSEEQAHVRAYELLAKLGMARHGDKKPAQLSGGERQRVAIARALANDPVIILADEPTGNLDSAASANVRSILHDLKRALGKRVIAVTHDSAFAAIADRRVGIVDGRLNDAWRPA